MTSFATPLTALVQFTDPETGYLTDQGRTIIQQLINRTGGANGRTIVFAGDQVYGVPVGGLDRGAYTTDPPLPVGVVYSQAEMSAAVGELLAVSKRLGALIIDLQAAGVIQAP